MRMEEYESLKGSGRVPLFLNNLGFIAEMDLFDFWRCQEYVFIVTEGLDGRGRGKDLGGVPGIH